MRRKKLLGQADQFLRDMKPILYAGATPDLVAHMKHFREDKDEVFLARKVTGIKQSARDSYEKHVGPLQTYESLYADTIQLFEKLEEEALSFQQTLSRKPSRKREHAAYVAEQEKALEQIAQSCSLSIYIIMTSDEEIFLHAVMRHPEFIELWTALPKDPSTLQ